MNTTELNTAPATQVPETRSNDLKLEVVILPVSDAERTKRFFASLGWREDADFVFTEDFRVLQFTPPGSQASIISGTGVTAAAPGSIDRLLLAVAARTPLLQRPGRQRLGCCGRQRLAAAGDHRAIPGRI